MKEIEIDTSIRTGDILIRIPAATAAHLAVCYHHTHDDRLVDIHDIPGFAQLVADEMGRRVDILLSRLEHLVADAGRDVLVRDPSLGEVFPPDDPQTPVPFDYDATMAELGSIPDARFAVIVEQVEHPEHGGEDSAWVEGTGLTHAEAVVLADDVGKRLNDADDHDCECEPDSVDGDLRCRCGDRYPHYSIYIGTSAEAAAIQTEAAARRIAAWIAA